jgi:acyl-CoA reductase-like NAD-dependent aldehyde dehydrogenase
MAVTSTRFTMMTIGGKEIAPERTFGVTSPATGSVFAEAPDCTAAQLDAAMTAAAEALQSWRKDEAERRKVLTDCAAAIDAHADEVARIETLEQGKPLKDSLGELQGAAYWFREFATFPIPRDVLRDDEYGRVEVHRKPLGVVGMITPWNFPVFLAAMKVAPALLAGNTVVLKPSPYTPLSTLRLGEVLREVLPPGVLNVVSGGDELGAAITAHPTTRKISFTGSIATGKKVAAAAALDLKRVVLELGGNDPAIVLDDVDPKRVAEKLFWGAFGNVGQVCIAVKRLYVHERVYPALVQEITNIAKSVRVGDGLDPTTQLGPLNNKPQLERVTELVEDARRSGATIVTGGERLNRPGYFYAHTVVTDIAEGTRLVDEEQFGPALPIMPFSDLDDVLERANKTHYGLGASVWTSDLAKGADVAAQLECGTAWVNKHGGVNPSVPFGGSKWSGIGYENGTRGLEAFCDLQVIELART